MGDSKYMIIPRKEYLLNGKTIILRSPEPEDAQTFLDVRIKTSEESYNMARYPEEMVNTIEKISPMISLTLQSDDEFLIGAFDGDKMIGCVGVAKYGTHIKYRHKLGLGISILKDYCNGGLGTAMMEYAIESAKQTNIEQLLLGVYDDNERAQHLYKKMGFVEWGREPRAFKHKDNTYHDEIQMVLMLK